MSAEDQKVNKYLWDYVHKLEFMLAQSENLKKRQEKEYAKKINLTSQHLDNIGVSSRVIKKCKL